MALMYDSGICSASLLRGLKAAETPPRKRRHRRRHQVQHGRRLAAVRAFTAAQLYLEGRVPSLATAAEACGSNVQYIEALLTLIRSENASLLKDVLAGRVSVLAVAAQTKQLAKLVAAYRHASAGDRVAFAKVIGPTTLFDNTLAPAL